MTRILLVVAVALLLTSHASAQSEANCEEIRQAVATYGFDEARRHALIHYGPEAVAAGEKKCLANEIAAREAALKLPMKRQQPKKAKQAAKPTKAIKAAKPTKVAKPAAAAESLPK